MARIQDFHDTCADGMKTNNGDELRLPKFLGIGPARTGTTWLHEVLTPVAGLPFIKETHFFSMRYRRGVEWYASHFREFSDQQPIGEICPYFGYAEAPARVLRHMRECKVFCTFRDPVDRVYSHYRVARRCGETSAGFEQALTELPLLLESGRYASHLREWQRALGQDRILVTTYEDLVGDRQAFVDNICDFIGTRRVSLAGRTISETAENRVERAPANANLARVALAMVAGLHVMRAHRTIRLLRRANFWSYWLEGGEVFPPVSAEVDQRVRARLRPEIEALEDLIQRDLSAWKTDRH
jgi:hypothetical protein